MIKLKNHGSLLSTENIRAVDIGKTGPKDRVVSFIKITYLDCVDYVVSYGSDDTWHGMNGNPVNQRRRDEDFKQISEALLTAPGKLPPYDEEAGKRMTQYCDSFGDFRPRFPATFRFNHLYNAALGQPRDGEHIDRPVITAHNDGLSSSEKSP